MKKHLKKLTSLTLAAFLASTCYICYQQVSADEGVANASANAGHFNVTNTTEGASSTNYGWSYSGSTGTHTITISATGDYTIAKDCTCDDDYSHSSYSIVIEGTSSISVNLAIEDINIENTSGAAMDIDGTSTVTLRLVGDNSFISSDNYAGIQFNNADTEGGSLIISSDSEDNTLTAKGGRYGAGIGGGYQGNGSNITISGGTVIATGGYDGAGIGGGSDGYGSKITITGGTVTATGGYSYPSSEMNGGAGIGGGGHGDGYNITISGDAVVIAEGGSYAAGIGGAGRHSNGYDITINGGTVIAIGDAAAGIGGAAFGGKGYNITITGGTVIAEGSGIGAGIGGSGGATYLEGTFLGDGYNIKITGGTVTAIGGESGAAIGGGLTGDGYNITIEGGTVIAKGYSEGLANPGGAGIGGGGYGNGYNIKITGGNVEAIGGTNAAGIGGGYGSTNFIYSSTGKSGDGFNIEISGDACVETTGGSYGAGIGGGINGSADTITISDATIIAIAGDDAQAIGAGSLGSISGPISIDYPNGVYWRTSSSSAFVYSTDGSDIDGTGLYVEIRKTISSSETSESTIIVDTSTK